MFLNTSHQSADDSNWILKTGFWNDSGEWEDDANWKDN